MNGEDFDRNELLRLIAEIHAGSLDPSSRDKLNAVLKSKPAVRRFYREHMALHARLILDYEGRQPTKFMPGGTWHKRQVAGVGRRIALAAAAAVIVLAAVLAWPQQGEGKAEPFATLEDSKAARWEASGLPTTDGSRLGPGSLRLAEGLATLRFDSGARVVIEGPAELTLVDAMQFQFTDGKAFAEIPDSAQSFRIATAVANVVDHGTRFSVIVDGTTGDTYTKVYQGSVSVEHLRSGEVVALETGQSNQASREELGESRSEPFQQAWPDRIGPLMRGPDWVLLPSSKDSYLGRAFREENGSKQEVHVSDTLLLVKNGNPRRKAYLGFDLADISSESIAHAELMLHFESTGWGLASLVPDATFSVFGLLTDQPWDEHSLRESNAPAQPKFPAGKRYGTGGPMLADHEVRKLGSFVIDQGVQQGQFGIEGETLAAFLRERAGSTLTLIVVRDTLETEINGLVHGFASRRHPTLPAPTLALRLEEP